MNSDEMIYVSEERWNAIDSDYKGEWQDYYNEHPEWLGRRVVMSACICDVYGKLYIEGVHFIITKGDV